MNEYISRDTVLSILADSEPKEEDWRMDNMENYDLRKIRFLAASNVYEEIKDVLSCKRLIADVAPVVYGHWKPVKGGNVACSRCGHIEPPQHDHYNFCPNCGMRRQNREI